MAHNGIHSTEHKQLPFPHTLLNTGSTKVFLALATLKLHPTVCSFCGRSLYRGADKSLARQGRKQATATEDFDLYICHL